VPELDQIIQRAAKEFVSAVFSQPWWGREREAISLFAFGYLLRQCAAGSVLFDPRQIAIEACVPGVPELNPKNRVNKDLVIWPSPAMTFWEYGGKEGNEPLAVMEWKVYRPDTRPPSPSKHDLEWLAEFSAHRPNFIGYAVGLDLDKTRPNRFTAVRIQDGQADAGWLEL
jgi:hypothetical protein